MPSHNIKMEDMSDCESDWIPGDPEPRAPVLRGQDPSPQPAVLGPQPCDYNGYSHFMLRNGKFTVQGHERAPASRIYDMMRTEMRVEKLTGLDREEVEAAVRGINRKWYFLSQCVHYGIFAKKQMNLSEDYHVKTIVPVVEEALGNGWFEKVPREIVELERKMRHDIRPDQAKYERDRAKFECHARELKLAAARQKRLEDNATWLGLRDNPGQQANFNITRFFKEYFLTGGHLNPRKTRNALHLDNITVETRTEVMRRVNAIDGLHFHHYYNGAESVFCIGVDQRQVQALALRIIKDAREQAEREHVREQEALFHEDMRKFAVLAGQLCRHRAEEFDVLPPSYKLRHCSGLFAIRSAAITQRYPRLVRHTLRISEKLVCSDDGSLAVVAGFDFGMWKGTLYAAESSRTLRCLLGDGPRDMDADSNDEGVSADGSRKRRRLNDQERSSLTLLLTFRGRRKLQDGSSEIFYVPRNGKLDFSDDYHCRLKGTVDLPGLGYVSFEGWKVERGVKGQNEPLPWGDFDRNAFHQEQQLKDDQQNPPLGSRERPQAIE